MPKRTRLKRGSKKLSARARLRKQLKEKVWEQIFYNGGWNKLNLGYVNIERMEISKEPWGYTVHVDADEGIQGEIDYHNTYEFKFDKNLKFIS